MAEGKPGWIRTRRTINDNYYAIQGTISGKALHTVCEEANCPNQFECWSNRTATFLILGRICTRACRFCAVTSGQPTELDLQEPERVAQAVVEMGLNHAVVTSVARDDLRDGGASVFAATIRAIRKRRPSCTVEVLIPDFRGDWDALRSVMEARPDILSHNVETVRRLTGRVRSKAKYERSLELLAQAKRMRPDVPTKSGIMVGAGERWEEILETMDDLRRAGCNILTIGQYLRPSSKHMPVQKYYHPDEFLELKNEGIRRGFDHVESGPLVRSSYRAHEHAAIMLKRGSG